MRWTRRQLCAAGLAAPWAGLARGATGDIVVGQIGPFTGIPVPDAPQLNQGIKACFEQVNARGGIGGRRISFFELDDTYTPDGFVKAFRQAMARQPVALLSPVGSAALKRMLDDRLLDGADVVMLNAVPGAETLRNPGHPKFFHVRAGDRQQIEKLVAHARTLGVSKLGVLHQNIPIGTSGLAVAQAAALQGDGMGVEAFASSLDPVEVSAAAAKVHQAGLKAVLVLGAPPFTVAGIAALRKAGPGQFIFALGYMPPSLVIKAAQAGARGVALSQTYPNPMGVSLPLQREFQAAMKQAAPTLTTYSSFHFEGYITARVFVEAARRARELNATGLAQTLHTMGEVDLGGFRVDFSRGNVGSSFVDVGVINGDGRLMY